MMKSMFGSSLLIAAVLAQVPLKTVSEAGEKRSWLSASVVGAALKVQRGLQAETAVGYANTVPVPLLVVDVPGSSGLPVCAEVHTAVAFFRMRNAAARYGLSLSVNSGFRTQERQQEVFDLYRRGRGPLAARPGFSSHQSGYAMDFDTRSLRVRRWLFRHAYKYGFLRTVPSENWHFEFRGHAEPLFQPDPLSPKTS
jgi:hypothetical protein